MFKKYDWLSIEVFRNDAVGVNELINKDPHYIVISPGPKFPSASGISMDVIDAFYKKRPILGVCLGMQCINEFFGGKTVKAPLPVHGKAYYVKHKNKGIFKGVPSPFLAARYHSLCVKLKENSPLEVDAICPNDGVIMGVSDAENMLFGVQFHPESFLTQYGDKIIQNFLDCE